ncbi:MAG: poly-gamma-glutamate system protein [Candidatus Neomarinimicrobiota bacterium]|nr:poly-gamma-glutamate system protein [Candidatus Neomarinimicrobiota bacterium]
MPDRPFKPVIQETRTLVLLAFISIAAYSIAYFSRKEFVSPTYEIKIKAATMMQESMNMLKNIRMEKGVFIDQENDPNETGLIGSQFSLITTDEGNLDAKLTTLDPNFAAAMVELLNRADLVRKDSIAVMLTGSMPGANMAMLIACKAMGIYPIIISSIGASQWGANDPEMTWLDMERILFNNGYISARSIAASIGGRNDQGRLLSPRGRELIRNNIDKSRSHLISGKGLEDNIDQRMQYFGNNNYKAVVNIGGGVASLGTSFNLRLLQPGIVYRKDIEKISRGDGIDGAVVRFSKQNIPLIHILNIQKLTDELGMEYAPIPLPEIGAGPLYAIEKYDLNMTILSLLIVSLSVVITGWKSKKQIKEIMTNHDPESII